ncbi:MAG: DUF4188 domain-containing protein [Alphaproteobacteria bacterium]|nr:DUF4188 domain-containing protein [Alphaproteobacteria bacterium]
MAIFPGRYAARLDRPMVLFLIGSRINRFTAIGKWLPVMRAMPRMIAELYARPESGFLHVESYIGLRRTFLIQYWRAFDDLLAYARDKDGAHFPAWAAFNKAVYAANSDAVGIWHETYVVEPGKVECVYGNMPAFGLAKATAHVLAEGRLASAADRMRGA